jgi:[ribosomal protein S5]-alanine N-acetyltransferase
MKTIETERLWLRIATPEIYKEVFENYKQEEATAFFGFNSEERFLEEKKKHTGGMTTHRTSFVSFHLIEKNTGRVIGDCGFHTWYLLHSRAEIGYGLREEGDKNKGYMKEAIQAVINYGFYEMGLNRIEAFVHPANTPSLKLVAALGFRQEGYLKEHYCKDGVIEDSLVFGLLRKEFESQKEEERQHA